MKWIEELSGKTYKSGDYEIQGGKAERVSDEEALRLLSDFPGRFRLTKEDAGLAKQAAALVGGVPHAPAEPIHLIEKVDIIIPIIGPLEPLFQLLDSIPAVMRHNVVVVNNSGQSSKGVRAEFPEVRFLDNECNLGWIGGLQQGLRHCANPYVVFMNSDLALPEKADEMFHDMVSTLETNEKAATVSSLRWEGGTDSTMKEAAKKIRELGKFVNLKPSTEPAIVQQINDEIQKAVGKRRVFETKKDVVLFCVMLKRAAYEEVGGFNEIYGLGYVDDADLTRRLRNKGWRHFVLASWAINHFNNTYGFKDVLGKGFWAYHKKNREVYNHYWDSIPQLPVLYVTWNRLDYTKKTLPPLLKDPDVWLVVAIDNASTDGTQEYLRKMEREYPDKLRVVLNEHNQRVAGAMNQFFDMVEPMRYWAKVDNDTLLKKGDLKKLLDLLKQNSADLLQAQNQTFRAENNLVVKGHLGGTALVGKTFKQRVPVTNQVLGWTQFQRGGEGRNLKKLVTNLVSVELLDHDEEGNKIDDEKYPRYNKLISMARGYESTPLNRVAVAVPKGRPKLLHVMCAYNEEHRYLEAVIRDTREHADRVIVIDDASNDKTADVARSLGAEVVRNEKNLSGQSETALRSKMWEVVRGVRPEWVLTLDADELFEPGSWETLEKLMAGSPEEFAAYRFYILHMWKDTQHVRVDKAWGGYNNIRLVRYSDRAGQAEKNKRWHSGGVPLEYQGQAILAKPKILHLGFVRERDRVEKYLKHMQRGGAEGDGIDVEHLISILDDNPELHEWTRGLPQRVEPVGPRRAIQLNWEPSNG